MDLLPQKKAPITPYLVKVNIGLDKGMHKKNGITTKSKFLIFISKNWITYKNQEILCQASFIINITI